MQSLSSSEENCKNRQRGRFAPTLGQDAPLVCNLPQLFLNSKQLVSTLLQYCIYNVIITEVLMPAKVTGSEVVRAATFAETNPQKQSLMTNLQPKAQSTSACNQSSFLALLTLCSSKVRFRVTDALSSKVFLYGDHVKTATFSSACHVDHSLRNASRDASPTNWTADVE